MGALTEQQINSKELSYLADNLCALMHRKGIDTKQLSALTGVSISLLNSLKRGNGNPTLGTLITLANFFDVTIDSLILSDACKPGTMMILPIYSMSMAHDALARSAVKNIYMKIEDENNAPDYGVPIDNSSLMPFFEKGSIFLISSKSKYMDGDIVFVRINSEYNVFRKVFIRDQGVFFQYISLDADPHNYSHYQILGPVIKVIHNMRALS